jgi:hypothetical protein
VNSLKAGLADSNDGLLSQEYYQRFKAAVKKRDSIFCAGEKKQKCINPTTPY